MSPNEQNQGVKAAASNNLYTILLALAFFAVLATSALVAYKCYTQYNTLLNIP
jgi:hypothetical protein